MIRQYSGDKKSIEARSDDNGRTYAFWMQEASDLDLNPRWRTLEYRVREDSVWADQGSLLTSQNVPGLGTEVALDVSGAGYPVLAFTRNDTLEGDGGEGRHRVEEAPVPGRPARAGRAPDRRGARRVGLAAL